MDVGAFQRNDSASRATYEKKTVSKRRTPLSCVEGLTDISGTDCNEWSKGLQRKGEGRARTAANFLDVDRGHWVRVGRREEREVGNVAS